MEEKLINGLKDLGYSGPLTDKKNLEVALQEGAKSIEYTKLVNFLTNEIRGLLNIDEKVNTISSPEDSVTFIMEVSSFLKELNCTYVVLTQGHISDRLQNSQDRLLLLDYLATELMGARILEEKKPDKKIELKLQETDEAANMRKILMTFRFPRPPPNITIQQLFQKVCPTVQTTVQKVGKDLVGNPAFNGLLSDKQWEILNGVQKDLNNEYKIRREMLLTRLDVTIQSFQWSDKTKGKDDLIKKIYTEKRKRLKTDPEVELADLLAARDDIAIIEKTSNSSVRKNTRTSLNKVIIGQIEVVEPQNKLHPRLKCLLGNNELPVRLAVVGEDLEVEAISHVVTTATGRTSQGILAVMEVATQVIKLDMTITVAMEETNQVTVMIVATTKGAILIALVVTALVITVTQTTIGRVLMKNQVLAIILGAEEVTVVIVRVIIMIIEILIVQVAMERIISMNKTQNVRKLTIRFNQVKLHMLINTFKKNNTISNITVEEVTPTEAGVARIIVEVIRSI
ncbi:protein FAM98A [Asbolus verrucosus]|uniref:Protein FAM98A n=1 Tax=Asbolus verrucosus TaxID=1661398 RepID=A0A482W0N2_ASBVE|nr:protein FAM98A [Asbolus verrucosus]